MPKSYQLNLPPPPPTPTTLAFPSTKIAPPDLLVLRPNRPIPRGEEWQEGSEDEVEEEEIVPPSRQFRPAPPRDADLLARQQRAHKLSSTLDRSGLGPRSPRVELVYSPPRPDPLPPPHPTIAATVADFALSVSPSGPLHPGSKIVIEVRLGDLEIVRRLDGSLPPLFVEVEGITLLAADFADEADVQEHVFFRDFFEDNVGEDGEDTVCYQAVLPRGGACSSCGTHSATFPPSFGPQDLESGIPRTSTVWTVRAAWGPQNEETVVLDVRAPSKALDKLLQDAKPTKIPFSSYEIVEGVQGKWSGLDLEDGTIEFTARPLNRDDSLLTIDVGLSFRFHPFATPADLETLLDRLKPSSNRGELYAALLDYTGDHLANLPGFMGEDLTAPLKVLLEVVGAQSADVRKQRVIVRLRLGVQAPLSQCRPFASCAGYRVEYRCKLSLGQLAYPGGVRDGMFLDFPLFQDDELKEVLSSEAGSTKGRRRASWWCGLPALWSKAKELFWGND